MKKVLNYHRPDPAPTPRSSSGDSAVAILVLNCLACGFGFLLLVGNNSTDPFAKGAVFLAEWTYLLLELPLGIGAIVYAWQMRPSDGEEKRKWILVVATLALVLGVVALASGPWPDRH